MPFSASLMALEKLDAEESLYNFVKLMWDVVEPATEFTPGRVLEEICDHLEAVTDGRIRRLIINVPPGCMKACPIDTQVLTTWGWKAHGDLRPGDFVFGPDGAPKRVEAVTEHRPEACFNVSFDDGASVIAGEGHLWAIERDVMSVAPKYTRGRKPEIVTTSNLRTTDKQGSWNRRPDRIAIPSPVSLPPKQLMVDPYTLGVWLGDGSSTDCTIYAAEQDSEHFSKLGRVAHITPAGTHGRSQAFYHIRQEGLRVKLRLMGLLSNKHIPEDYLTSGVEQRWELLRGLMDTDGCAVKGGSATFTNKNKAVIDGMVFLCRSLGLKPWVKSRYTKLNGITYGPHYHVGFTAPEGARIFNLARKQERIVAAQNARSRYRYVEAVEPVGDKVVNCIQVEGGMYLVGRDLIPTHNSLVTNVFWPAWEWGPKKMPHLRYLTLSYSSTLTERDNGRTSRIVESEKYQAMWGDVIKLTKTGVSKLETNHTGWKFASSVGGTVTGERGDRVVIDDPNDVRTAESDTVRNATNMWLREVMPSRLNNMRKSAIVVIQQRTHEHDATGILLELDQGYDHLCLPMRYESWRDGIRTSIGGGDWRTYEGELLWDTQWPDVTKEGRYPLDEVEKLERSLGDYGVSGQLQQVPSPRGGGIIKKDWWQPWEQDKYPPMEYIFMTVDTATSTKDSADYSACIVWGMFRDTDEMPRVVWRDGTGAIRDTASGFRGSPRIMMMHAWEKRLTIHDLVVDLIHTAAKFGVDSMLIEAKSTGQAVAQELHRMLSGEASCSVQLDILPGSMDKMARLISVQHIFQECLVYAPVGKNGEWMEWAGNVIDRVAAFPRVTHDDLVDCTSAGIRHARDINMLSRSKEHMENESGIIRYKNAQARAPLYDT